MQLISPKDKDVDLILINRFHKDSNNEEEEEEDEEVDEESTTGTGK